MQIRKIQSLAEMHEVERLQKEIWGVADLDVYPALALKPQTEVGAILIGAFDDERLVGFVFGFPGILEGETIIHSDMLGISEQYRSHNLGYQLKLAQRTAALELGVERITWTFDPLQSGNAHFNFSKLGVFADRYYVDYYGMTSSFLHRLGTDRLWVTWLLQSERVTSRLEKRMAQTAPADLAARPRLVQVGQDQEPVVADLQRGAAVVVEIPSQLTAHHERWREATRAAFTSALDAGFFVEGFYVSPDRRTGSYLLSRR